MIPLVDLERELGVEDSAQSALIEQREQLVVAEIQSITGRYYGLPAQTIEYLNGNALRALRFSQAPAAGSPAPVVERESEPGTWELIPTTDYQIIERELRHDVGWTQGTRNYRITFTRGYTLGSTDPEYQLAYRAVLDHMKQWFRDQQNGGLKSESMGTYSYSAVEESGAEANDIPDSLRALRGWVYA